MNIEKYSFEFETYASANHLAGEDALLVNMARNATKHAYAPYSNFSVGAAARLANGAFVEGSNQENASFPAGICAERVLLSAAATLHPGTAVDTIAISYHNLNGESNRPISPCGICRQSLLEYEQRFDKPVRLLLSGMEGKVFVIPGCSFLLPLAFGSSDLK